MRKRGAYLKFPALRSLPRKKDEIFFSRKCESGGGGIFAVGRGGGGGRWVQLGRKKRGGGLYSVSGLQGAWVDGGGDIE